MNAIEQWVFIEALDVWMFRDARPFTAGQNFYARSLFPPLPGTMAGVVRSHYLETRGINFDDFRHSGDAHIGTPNSLGELWLRGPFLARREQSSVVRYLPQPLDLLSDGILAPSAGKAYTTEPPFDGWLPLVKVGGARAPGKEKGGGWLSEEAFARYLRGEVPATTSGDTLYQPEGRTGLALDSRRRTGRESQFYRAEFIRPCDGVGLLVGLSLPVFDAASGVVNIGGESRSGLYSLVASPAVSAHTPQGRIKLVLHTPAYFGNPDDGYLPAGGDWSRWLGAQARLVSVAIGKPQAVSGWDVARNQPKALRHLVPAGSVYYFENAVYNGQPFTESPAGEAEFQQMGFGAVSVGTWDYAD